MGSIYYKFDKYGRYGLTDSERDYKRGIAEWRFKRVLNDYLSRKIDNGVVDDNSANEWVYI
jgi:hypothetical protein